MGLGPDGAWLRVHLGTPLEVSQRCQLSSSTAKTAANCGRLSWGRGEPTQKCANYCAKSNARRQKLKTRQGILRQLTLPTYQEMLFVR
jgi:hypothetical protein